MIRQTFPTLALGTAALPLQAAETAPDLASSVAQMLGGLAIVVVLLLGSLWLIKRLTAPRGAASGLKVLGGISLGSRERVVLVEVAGKVLVLGVSSASITTLHTLDASELAHTESPPAPSGGGEFSRWLKTSLEQRRNSG